MLLLFALPMAGQTRIDTIRYVKTAENGGAYTNNGRSWSTAKSDLQDAINDLHEYLKENNLTSGSIYVAAGTYKPSESTESNGGGLQFTSFKIYPGIHVYGGFSANETDMDANPFEMENGNYKYRPITSESLGSIDEYESQPWNFQHKTELSGSHGNAPTFTFDETKGTYSTLFPSNSYHVVWFATEGFIPVSEEGDQPMHALPLSQPASIDGCTITGGYAATKTTNERNHTSYGGGAYMVPGARLSRCVVDHCEAIMRGGGVYLDGGGVVDRCYINTCQSPGVGIMQGYGGGVCIDYDGTVTRSYIVNNSSRIGAGITICHAEGDYPWKSLNNWLAENGQPTREKVHAYSPQATACIVSNNTATAEGAGIYFYEGGTGNHLTITNNNCVGQDITYYGRRHGRSGGVYILNGGQILNSVIWGNKCAANNDIQYAVNTVGSTADEMDGQGNVTNEGLKPKISYTAIDKHDITDWAGSTKNSIISLESENINTNGYEANYPYFIGSDGEGTVITATGAGLQTDIPRPLSWKPASITSMAEKGLQVTEAVNVSSVWFLHAHTATDLFNEAYEPMSTLGALVRLPEQMNHALVTNQEIALYRNKGFTQTNVDAYATALGQNELKTLLPDEGDQATLPTIFVDPSRNAGAKGISIGEQGIGASWDKPVKNINDAIYYFKQRQWAKGTANEFQYNIGGTKNSDGSFSGGTDYPYVQILVKGFGRGSTVRATTAGRGAYLGPELRTAAIRPSSNMRIYGGFAPTSTGTTTTGRNARTYPTLVTGNITNTDFSNNSAHIVALINVKNVIIDGLRLSEGNSRPNENGQTYAPIDPTTGQPYPITYGAGLIMNNATVAAEDRIDMTGNILRNAYISNCAAPYGAAIYVNSGNKKADDTNSAAELSIVNTIIRNNTVGSGTSDVTASTFGNAGVITARGNGAKIRLDHCDIVNNTGFPLETLETEEGTGDEGKIYIYNSVIYANGEVDNSNRKRINKALSYRSNTGSQTNVEGKYIYLDWDAPLFPNLTNCEAVFCRDMSEQYEKWGIRKKDANGLTMLDGTGNPIVFYEDSETAARAHTASDGCNTEPILLDYPFFENPSKNSGYSEEGDKPMNGGLVSYMPQNMNPMVNAAISQSSSLWDSDCYQRTYGGIADIGAIEDRDQPLGGTVKYVRTPADGGDDNNDGNSWKTAYATIRHALDVCRPLAELSYDNETVRKANRVVNPKMEIWVAAGKYNEYENSTGDEDILSLVPGVNMYGGFARKGNPGKALKENERQIGNNELYDGTDETKTKYQTIIDGGGKGRVLAMQDNFPIETIVEGFTIQNGHNPKVSQTYQVTMWKEQEQQTIREYSLNPVSDGWTSYDGTIDNYRAEVSSTDDYDEVVEEAGPYMANYDRQGTRNGGNSTNARNTFRQYVTNENDRKNANSEANAFYDSTTKTYYWGETVRTGSSTNYDWVESNYYYYNYYRWTNWYYRQYYKNKYYKRVTAYYRDILKTVYVPNTADYPQHMTDDNTTQNVTIKAGHFETNEGFSREGGDYRDGAGARMYENGIIKNCLIWKNKIRVSTDVSFAAGIALLKGSRMESSIVRNNVLENVNVNDNKFVSISRGGAVHAAGSTVINSLIVENAALNGQAYQGVGLYISAKSDFYQCTIAYNFGITGNPDYCQYSTGWGGRDYRSTYVAPGIWDDSDRTSRNPSSANICHFYNCIIWGNAGIGRSCTNYAQHYVADQTADNDFMSAAGGRSTLIGRSDLNLFDHCYHAIPRSDHYAMATGNENVLNVNTYTGNFVESETGNTFTTYNYTNTKAFWDACQAQNFFNESQPGYKFDPFLTTGNYVTDLNANNAYNADAIIARATKNPYDINPASELAQYNINMGNDDSPVYMENTYGITIDINGADRVQDCQVDKGAYEYDGAKEIKPGYELIAFDPENPSDRELCAVYYVGSGRGLASADSPNNMACARKLQLVLDAAGRLKADLKAKKDGTLSDATRYSTTQVDLNSSVTPTYEEVYVDGTTKKVRKVTATAMSLTEVKHVIVKVLDGTYYPTRPTNDKMVTGDAEEIVPMRSLMIPHGVEVMGGYRYENDANIDFTEAYRDPLNYKTTFIGDVMNEQTGAAGQAYHVVTFTNNIYDITNTIYKKNGLNGEDALNGLITDRAVIDGISIEHGLASGTDEIDKCGGACVVTDFAHVRNCIIQDNEATQYGGGLYLLPGAMVSGCVILNNKAEYGGAVYAEEPASSVLTDPNLTEAERELLFARIYNTTIVHNSATVRGGGLWYDTNIRSMGAVLWQNSANDMNNVAGVFDTGDVQNIGNYPFAYSAVQARRLPGVNNIELRTENEKGTRWTKNSISDMRWRGDKPYYSNETNSKDAYYYIEKLSVLVRSGMPYRLYSNLRETFPSLELRDMAGVARMKELYNNDVAGTINYLKHQNLEPQMKDNAFLEIGARALNFQMGHNFERPFTRLYVVNPEDVDVEKATRLLECGDPLYSQQGSSMANPFQKFSDALDYVVELRNYGTDASKNIYRDTRFEIFIAGGTHYPYHNALGVEGLARSSTFLLPEGVTITGGVDPKVMYCQKGYNFPFLQPTATAATALDAGTGVATNKRTEIYAENGSQITDIVTFEEAITNDIWENRPQEDINGNKIYEPWEFRHATTFSGETPRGIGNEDNVYHVFTSLADPKYIGTLPRRYSGYTDSGYNRFSGELNQGNSGTEHSNSELHRMIIINGINVTNGNARDYESESVINKNQFYRGGGILVDGSWTDAEHDSGETNPDDKGNRDIPMMLIRSQFQNNAAIQGGAVFTNGSLTVFSCSFVQNYTEGPKSNENIQTALNYVKYTGGGAIATNGTLRVANSIFANNEAMLGEAAVQLQSSAPGYTKQAFGGAIWGGADSNVRILNCNIVNNQSVSYPCVYINRDYGTETYDPKRFAANTIFWGNAITGENASTLSGFSQITDINRDVFSYRTKVEKDAEIAGIEDYSDRQPLFFSAYRETYGPTPTLTEGKVSVPSGYETFGAVEGDFDPHEVPFLGEGENIPVNYHTIFGANNNINITFANEGVDGPNFILPSNSAGKEGYNPAANWAPARVNNLTDNGWGYLTLTAKTASGDIEFKQVGGNPNTNTGGTPPENCPPDNAHNVSGGLYNFYSWMLQSMYNLTFMPLGDQKYMTFENTNMTDGGDNKMRRISSNPLTFEEAKAYIDLGVYEYQHRNLRINQNSEIDILWVTDTENPENGNDGYEWNTATSNLQAAIETLMKSRNDHAKQINIIAGEYKPSAVLGDEVDKSLSFTIQTHPYNNGAYTPMTGDDYGIKSLTFRGGYDKEIPGEDGYDFTKNEVTLSIEPRIGATPDQLNHIVNILDAEQWTTSVSEQGERSNINRGVAIPITFEGITFNNTLASGIDSKNKGGAAIYYRKQMKWNSTTEQNYNLDDTDESHLLGEPARSHYVEQTKKWVWDWENNWDPTWETAVAPKLTIRNCKFTQNGQDTTDPTSAVYIEGGGGSSLIVNSLFEHNTGDPVNAVNTTVLNSTFALNGGYLKLTESSENNKQYHSELHNSVIWKDDQRDSQSTQFTGVSTGTRMTYNAITGLSTTEDANHNVGLSDTNNDVIQGPNFVDPENEDVNLCDYRIRPGKLLVNTGDNDTYGRFVWPSYTTADYADLMTNTHPDQEEEIERETTIRVGETTKTIRYTILKAPKDYELAFQNRMLHSYIDRGAYECTSRGQRIIYMNPNKTTGTETGRTWEEAYGQGQLQRAIDAAYVYPGEEQSYVFVKGQREGNTHAEETITFRDGVNIFGSIQANSGSQAVPILANEEELRYTDEEVDAFVNRIRAERRGLANNNTTTTPTIITGITSVAGDYTKGSLVDGFIITNSTTSSTPATTPVVNITIPNMTLRNSIVTGNTMADGQPVVNLTDESLLYNVLVYGNKAGTTTPGTVVNVGNNSYVLNCTVVADNEGETPIGGDGATTRVKNTIAVNEYTGKAQTFAPYQRQEANSYTPATFLTTYKPYWYQLHEESSDINTGDETSVIESWLPSTLLANVNFDLDRDLLGNPRRIGGNVDNGAFETWKISGERETANTTNEKPDLNKYVTDGQESFDPDRMVAKATYWNTNYGGHLYPHQGSVVYIDENAVLSISLSGDDKPNIRPGYLLVKEGGSLYGNGNVIQAEYVAAERTMDGQYGLLAMPFDYDIANAYTAADGTAAQTNCQLTPADNAFYYDGTERSEWDYHFKDEDSECWKPLPSTSVAANDGWLIDLEDKTNLQTVPIRFTGWAATSGLYAYTEDGTTKTVTLTQYDDRTSTNGRADFTRQENMGWNLKGVPFLVSDYQTSTLADDTYQMNVPHVIYSTLGTNDATYGQFYTAQSWANGATLALGKAFFTQTAVIGDTETLYFKQPVYDGTAEAPVKESLMLFDEEEQADAVELHPQDGADAAMSYRMGSDGVKWFSLNDEANQLYVVNGDGTPLSLVSAAPVDTEIPLGIRAGHEGRIAIALPSPDVYADYENVWLTDHEAGVSTDLLQGGYVMDICEAGIINNRLTLKFGGMPELAQTEGPAIEKLAARGGRLPLRRYAADDLIRIHTASGALVYRGRYGNFSNSGLADGIYIIER